MSISYKFNIIHIDPVVGKILTMFNKDLLIRVHLSTCCKVEQAMLTRPDPLGTLPCGVDHLDAGKGANTGILKLLLKQGMSITLPHLQAHA